MPRIEPAKMIGVVGAGTMGAGIAQVAAAAGHAVRLYDAFDGAAHRGLARTQADLMALVKRGRMAQDTADGILSRIAVADQLEDLAEAALVVEAVVEDLEVKRQLFGDLERLVAADAILATNTSSISVTAIGRNLERPERLAGLHFFNPAPVMKLVEIVAGLATEPEVGQTLFETATCWGKVAVHTKSTPGFIVNRVARPFYAEALRLLEEKVGTPQTLDALLTGAAGFRMGPFELMDLIGHDVNYAVTRSIFDAYYQDPKFRPSIAQLELVNAGRLGRKTGRGFYRYDGSDQPVPDTLPTQAGTLPLSGWSAGQDAVVEGVQIATTDGRTAAQLARTLDRSVIVCDYADLAAGAKRIGFATSLDLPPSFLERFVATLAHQGLTTTLLPDWPGLVVMRTLATIANEAFDAMLQGVADAAGIDAAMCFGVNYPRGPIGWAQKIGLGRILAVLNALHASTGDPRYRASLALRREAGG